MPASVLDAVARHIVLGVGGAREPAEPAGAPQPVPAGPGMDSQFRLGPDSLRQHGVPKGQLRGPHTLPCAVFQGTQHRYWVYVPAQYDAAVPTVRLSSSFLPSPSPFRSRTDPLTPDEEELLPG